MCSKTQETWQICISPINWVSPEEVCGVVRYANNTGPSCLSQSLPLWLTSFCNICFRVRLNCSTRLSYWGWPPEVGSCSIPISWAVSYNTLNRNSAALSCIILIWTPCFQIRSNKYSATASAFLLRRYCMRTPQAICSNNFEKQEHTCFQGSSSTKFIPTHSNTPPTGMYTSGGFPLNPCPLMDAHTIHNAHFLYICALILSR